jgi:L-lactate utilization protein LutB
MRPDWEQAWREKPVNEKRVMAYRRLMRAAERISEARAKGGESWPKIEEALTASELSKSEVHDEPDLYLTSLTRLVAALGGHVEVHAVFPEETITVLGEPGPEAEAAGSDT